MQFSGAAWVGGYLKIRCVTPHPALLLETLKQQRIYVWDVHFGDDEALRMSLRMADFFRIRPAARETNSRIELLSKHGRPMFQRSFAKRMFFWGGAVACLMFVWLLTSLVWHVEITGNQRLSADDILAVAKKQGVFVFQWSDRIAQPTVIAGRMQRELPGITWIGIEKNGVTVRIRVVEGKHAPARTKRQGHHLVATKTAVITHIFAERGQPLVSRNQRVSKGDVLISGWIGSPEHAGLVQAEGEVKGLVWYHLRVVVPLTKKQRVFTGRSHVRTYAAFAKRKFLLSGYNQHDFKKYVVDTKPTPWRLIGLTLPVEKVTETAREYTYVMERLTPAVAKQTGINQARSYFLRNYSIAKQRLTSMRKLKDRLEMRVFFEVEQPIAEFADVGPTNVTQ